MLKIKNPTYYVLAIGIFILLKFAFTFSNNSNLAFLLKPTNRLVGILANSPSVYSPEKGYFHESLNIIIDKSCSGFNLWVLTFLMLSFLFLKYAEKKFQRVLVIPASLALAYIITVFVNVSRIYISIVTQSQINPFLSENQQPILHEAIGVITNLTFLILIYFTIDKYLNKKQNHAKLT